MSFKIIQGFDNSSNEPLDAVRVIAADEDAMRSIKWVYDGLLVTRLDTTPRKVFVCTVPAATDVGSPYWTAAEEWEEFTGTAGTDGIDGSQIFSDAGVPDDGDGAADGDFYLNSNTGDYYIKGKTTPGEWGALQGNLQGIQGIPGDVGTAGADGDRYATTSVGPIDFTASTDPLTVVLVDSGLNYTVGQTVIVANRLNTDDNLTGDVLSYSGTSLQLENITYDPAATGTNITTVDVNLSGAPGPAGYTPLKGVDYDDGVVGKAIIHSEADIDLTAAKINEVANLNIPFEGTPENPYTASVQTDNRDPKNTPGMTTDMTKHSIAWDGTNWSDNGRWTGQDGIAGSQILEGSAAPLPEDGVDGDFWINNTNSDYYLKTLGSWGSPSGNLKGNPGDDGDDGIGIVEYHYQATSNLTEVQFMALGGDFTIPCIIHLELAKGVRVSLPTLGGSYPNAEIREVRVTRLNPYYSGSGVCFVWGKFIGHDQMTSPHFANTVYQADFPQIDVGEVGVFKPVKNPGGGYQSFWTTQISGRGLERTTKWREYTAPNDIVVGDSGYLQGRWMFRVSNGIVHYGGGITVKSGTSGIRADSFDLGELITNPMPFLPDPETGVQFASFNQVGPADLALFPLTPKRPTRYIADDRIYPLWGTQAQKEDFNVGLVFDGANSDPKKRLRLIASVENSSTHKFNGVQFGFGGSYIQSSQVTAAYHFLQGGAF